MDFELTQTEARIVGCLIEKQMTTPDYYPMTMNALLNACNQKSNRHPVVKFEEDEVLDALESLRAKGLTVRVSASGGRAPKHRHTIRDRLKLSTPEIAVSCVLMLRGPQTLGEIRGRTERLHTFVDLAEVESTLEGMRLREDGPLVVKLPRQAGRKESRYAHLLCGEPEIIEETPFVAASPARQEAERETEEKLSRHEAQIQAMQAELTELREQFSQFKKQFE